MRIELEDLIFRRDRERHGDKNRHVHAQRRNRDLRKREGDREGEKEMEGKAVGKEGRAETPPSLVPRSGDRN